MLFFAFFLLVIGNVVFANDRCGCPFGQGWSTHANACRHGSTTEPHESCHGNHGGNHWDQGHHGHHDTHNQHGHQDTQSQQGGTDRCGCSNGQGWSTHANACAWGSTTEPHESCHGNSGANNGNHWDQGHHGHQDTHNQHGGTDRCGCSNGQGWSTRANACAWGSTTEPHESCHGNTGSQPSHDHHGGNNGGNNGAKDRCGCSNGQGWSSRSHKCEWGSTTETHESCNGNTGSQPSGGGHTGLGGSHNGKCQDACPYHNNDAGSAACLIKDGDRVFLIMHSSGGYDLPGGTYGDHAVKENSKCVAWRETCEETGFNVEVHGSRPHGGVYHCTIIGSTHYNEANLGTPWEVRASQSKWFTKGEIERTHNFRSSWGGVKRQALGAFGHARITQGESVAETLDDLENIGDRTLNDLENIGDKTIIVTDDSIPGWAIALIAVGAVCVAINFIIIMIFLKK